MTAFGLKLPQADLTHCIAPCRQQHSKVKLNDLLPHKTNQGWRVQSDEVLAFVQATPTDGTCGALVVRLRVSPR